MWPGSLSLRGFLLRCAASTLALVVCGLAHRADAELAWKQRSVELHADAKSTMLEARFPFTNIGTAPLEITSMESSCGCTVATLEKRHYEPRESGEIVARYTVGAAVGAQQKTVQVTTNDGREPTILTLNIQIPEILRVKPAFVSWKHGERLTPKTIILEMLQDTPLKDISAQSSAVGFVTELKPLVPGRKYELTVRPLTTDQHQFSTLAIRCRFGEEDKVFRAYATVRPPEIKD